VNERNEKYRTKITEACQPFVDEPIREVGFFQPKGTAGAAATRMLVSNLLGSRKQAEARAAAGGAPDIGLYALTDSALHVLEAKPKGFNWKVKRHVVAWPRASFTAAPMEGRMTGQVAITFTDGTTVQLEAIRMGSQDFNADIIGAMVS
jgi:hypothetical protein